VIRVLPAANIGFVFRTLTLINRRLGYLMSLPLFPEDVRRRMRRENDRSYIMRWHMILK
jgi:hypothetical protein